MIVTENKPEEEVLGHLKDYHRVFVIGCGSCATASRTGGDDECRVWTRRLGNIGKEATGYVVPEETCHVMLMKSTLRQSREALSSDALLVLACGAGVQAVAAATGKPVIAGLNTVFLGTTYRAGEFMKYCSLCGSCVLSRTAGICPVTRCAKGLLNGPCGGMVNGMCETDKSAKCAWVEIYEKLEPRHEESMLSVLIMPRASGNIKHKKVEPKKLSQKGQ